MTITEFAKIAFDAYCQERQNLTYDGKPNPKWEDLPSDVRKAWETATLEIIEAYNAEFC